MLTCFISAPAGVNLSGIERILKQKGLEFVSPSEIVFYGQSISENISRLISRSDLFIAVLDKPENNNNLMFEVGIASAQKKQIIILIPPEILIPSYLSGFLCLMFDTHYTEAFEFVLDQLLASPVNKSRKRQFKKPHTSNKLVDNKYIELRNRLKSPNNTSIYEIERAFGDILKESGITVTKQSGRSDMGADFAIWSDDLGTILGNPILIEIKNSIMNSTQVKNTTNQIQNYLAHSNSKSALVFYLEGIPSLDAQKVENQFNIMFFQLDEFLEQLQERSFADVVWNRRNMIVHGRST